MRRREALASLLASALCVGVGKRAFGAETPASELLEQHDLKLPGDARLARRSLLLVPRGLRPGQRVALLVLLHGLGETGNELLGIHAWGDLYGGVSSYERLMRAPVQRTLPKQNYLTETFRAHLNASLGRWPFEPLALACPVTPNPHRLAGARTLDAYADWLEQVLLPAVRERAPAVLATPQTTALDGCSLGGYVGLEVWLRRPALFAALGGIQAAIGAGAAAGYARRIAAALQGVGPKPLRFASSSLDPYLEANKLLSRELLALQVPNTLAVHPGPHNQPWLREVGTLDLLLWHSRQLAQLATPEPRRVIAPDPHDQRGDDAGAGAAADASHP